MSNWDVVSEKPAPNDAWNVVSEKPAEKKPNVLSDVAKGIGSGIAQDVLAPFDLAASAGNWVGKKAARLFNPNAKDVPTETPSEQLGVDYKPETTAGRYAQIATEVAPLAYGLGGAAKKGLEHLAEKGAGKLINPENASLLETARQFDIPVFRSQVSKSQPTKMVGSFMKDVPLSGAEGRVTEQVEKFNNAVMKTMGGGGQVTPENLGKTYDRLSGVYEDLTKKYNIPVTKALDDKLLELSEKAQVQLAGDPQKLDAFHKYWNLTVDNMKTGKIDGKTYQLVRSGIGRTLRGQNTSPELGQLQNLIDEHFQSAMNPKDAQKFLEARQQYRRMIAVEKVLKTGEKGQGVSPSKLQGAVKQVFGNYAYGGDDPLEKLARLGTILKDTFPQSGTAPRSLANDVAKELAKKGAGAVLGVGGAGVPIAASRYLGTPYLYQDIAKSPAALANITRILGESSDVSGVAEALKVPLQNQP